MLPLTSVSPEKVQPLLYWNEHKMVTCARTHTHTTYATHPTPPPTKASNLWYDKKFSILPLQTLFTWNTNKVERTREQRFKSKAFCAGHKKLRANSLKNSHLGWRWVGVGAGEKVVILQPPVPQIRHSGSERWMCQDYSTPTPNYNLFSAKSKSCRGTESRTEAPWSRCRRQLFANILGNETGRTDFPPPRRWESKCKMKPVTLIGEGGGREEKERLWNA